MPALVPNMNIEIIKGLPFRLLIPLTSGGEVFNPTAYMFDSQIRNTKGDLITTFEMLYVYTDGIAQLALQITDTSQLPVGIYKYDIVMTNPSDVIATRQEGELTVAILSRQILVEGDVLIYDSVTK